MRVSAEGEPLHKSSQSLFVVWTVQQGRSFCYYLRIIIEFFLRLKTVGAPQCF